MLDSTSPPRSGWRAPVPKSQRNYPMNCWWVAALSSEVGRSLSGRRLLDMPSPRGAAVHRVPQRDSVQCGYHGFTFAPDGACVKIPSMKSVVFGFGVHQCLGQMVARLEMELVLTELVKRCKSIRLGGSPKRRLNNTLHSLAGLPVVIEPCEETIHE
jgi:Cytochrome P450/Rieske [2Fe-2S] domain